MSATTLRDELAKFSQPSFKAGYVAAFFERGMAETLEQVQYVPFEGDSHRFELQTSRANGASARHPMSDTAPPSDVGGVTDIRIYAGQLSREFSVPIHAQKVMSETNDQTLNRAQLSADAFFAEYLINFFHGDGSFQLKTSGADANIVGDNLNGQDFYLDQYAGKYKEGSFTSASADNVLWFSSKFKKQKQWGTTTGQPEFDPDNREVLTYSHVDAAIAQIKGRKDNLVIISDQASWLRFLKSLRSAGGNTQSQLMGEDKVLMPTYDGKFWLVSDTVGSPKQARGNETALGLATTGTADTGATIPSGDLDALEIKGDGEFSFIGFSDIDVGRVVTVSGADFSAASGHDTAVDDNGVALANNQTRIKQVVDNRNVILEHACAAGGVTDVAFDSDPVPAIYINRFGNTVNPIAALYGTENAADQKTYDVNMGEYYGQMAGFDVLPIGIKQAGGNFQLYRAIWDGQFLNEDPFNFCRLAGYKLS